MSMRRPYPSGKDNVGRLSLSHDLVCHISDPSLSSMSNNGHTQHLRTNEVIEGQNDQLVEQMADKIKQLRSVSGEISS